jgi:hypothetical protein
MTCVAGRIGRALHRFLEMYLGMNFKLDQGSPLL